MKMTTKLSLIPLAAFAMPLAALAQNAVAPYVGTNQAGSGAVINSPVGTSACPSCVPMPVQGSISVTGGTFTSAIAGLTPSITGTGVTGLVLKASAGVFENAYITTGSISGFLMVYNGTSIISNAATTIGTATGQLQDCIVAPANATTAINYNTNPGESFSAGIVAMFSTTGCGSLTGSTTSLIMHGIVQ